MLQAEALYQEEEEQAAAARQSAEAVGGEQEGAEASVKFAGKVGRVLQYESGLTQSWV